MSVQSREVPAAAIRTRRLPGSSPSVHAVCPLRLSFSGTWALSFHEHCVSFGAPSCRSGSSKYSDVHFISSLTPRAQLVIKWTLPPECCLAVSSSPSRTSQPCDRLLHCCSSFSTSCLILQVPLCLAWFSLLKAFARSPCTLPFLFCCSSLPPAELVVHTSVSRGFLNKLCFLTPLQLCSRAVLAHCLKCPFTLPFISLVYLSYQTESCLFIY